MSDVKRPIPQEMATDKLSPEEVRAIRAVYAGDANEYNQRLAIKAIVNKFTRAQDVLYIPGDTHATAFLQGRAHVGANILKTLKLPIGKLIDEEDLSDAER